MNKYTEKPPLIIITGSCIDFNHERKTIMDVISDLEWSVHTKSDCECSSSGNALGWDFFQIYFYPDFVEKLLEVFPEILKQEGNMVEQQFVLWLDKFFKKKDHQYYLKLSEVPYESARGFRLNPENYRNEDNLKDLR